MTKRGAWYYVPNIHKLPDHVTKKVSQVKPAPDGKALIKFTSLRSMARTAVKAAKAGYLDPAKAEAAQDAADVEARTKSRESNFGWGTRAGRPSPKR